MAKQYAVIIIWFGGTVTDTILERSRSTLFADSSGRHAVDLMIKMRSPSEQLSLGLITPLEFCKQAAEICGSDRTSSEIQAEMLASASLNQPAIDLIAKIPPEYERWLVVDYPADWYRELSGRWGLQDIFPLRQTIYISGLKLTRLVPEIFYRLPSCASRRMDECLVIDPISKRAVAAMRHGMASIIYVYPDRLKHELALQGILPTDMDVMHPTSSERVKM